MGFAAGFNAGSGMVNTGLGIARRRRLDEEDAKDRALDRRRAEGDIAHQEYTRGRQREADSAFQQLYEGATLGTQVDPNWSNQKLGVRDEASAATAAPRGPKLGRADVSQQAAELALRYKGDVGAYQQGMQQSRDLREQDLFAQGVNAYMANPASADEDIRKLSAKHPTLSIGPATDAKGKPVPGYMMSSVDPTGATSFRFISPAQMAKLAGASALMQHNPQKALTIIGEVDTSLAQAIAQANQLQSGSMQANNQTTRLMNADANDLARLGIERQKLGVMRGSAARENAALKKLEMGDKLGMEAQGYAMGFDRARALGKEGESAAQMYDELYKGAQVRGTGLGMKLPELMKPKETLGTKEKLDIMLKAKELGMDPAEVEMMISGVDPLDEVRKIMEEQRRGASADVQRNLTAVQKEVPLAPGITRSPERQRQDEAEAKRRAQAEKSGKRVTGTVK